MAAVFGPQCATPYSMSYFLAGTDGAVGTHSTAQLLADMSAGPLRETIRALDGHLDTLNVGGVNHGKVQIRQVTAIAGNCTVPASYDVHWTASALSIQTTPAAEFNFEIRLAHSSDR